MIFDKSNLIGSVQQVFWGIHVFVGIHVLIYIYIHETFGKETAK